MPRPITDDAVPGWVHTAVSAWARAKRRIWEGSFQIGEATHIDGFPARSVLDRIRKEREGASNVRPAQSCLEVMTGDALKVNLAIIGMPERPYVALHLVHVFPPQMSNADKAQALGCGVRELHAAASRARVWIHARLESNSAHFDLTAIIGQALREALQLPSESATRFENLANSPPQMDFAPLARPTLRLHR